MILARYWGRKRPQSTIDLSRRGFSFVPYLLLVLMIFAILALGVLMPLRTLGLFEAFPHTPLGPWLLQFTQALFPGHQIVGTKLSDSPSLLASAWSEAAWFFGDFALLFLIYAGALIFLPGRVSYQFIFFSCCLLGLVCLIIPALGSQDIFSYIVYARIGIVYHLNPLTTVPSVLPLNDPLRGLIYWKDQPSAYGTTWIAITCFLQYIATFIPQDMLVVMVLLMRLWGLVMLLGSLQLLWSITGRHQQQRGIHWQRTRLLAVVALAWNPFLLFEGVINAHIDMTIVFFVLLALWFLQRFTWRKWGTLALVSVIFGLAVCLKVNVVIFFPGLLLFLWTQSGRSVSARLLRMLFSTACFVATIIVLYAPFWQSGAVLTAFHINPSLTRDANSPYDFFLRLSLAFRGQRLIRPNMDVGSDLEIMTHHLSEVLYVIGYAAICAWFLFVPRSLNSLTGLIRWMGCIWLAYCIIGSPWYMPWYTLTFISLAALLVGMREAKYLARGSWHTPTVVYALSCSMFALYILNIYATNSTFILPHVSLGSIRELLDWLVLLIALCYPLFHRNVKEEAVPARLARAFSGFPSAPGKVELSKPG